MPLSVGARLGPYEILALIGKGGMGEVYKARDTRLGRIVAVKRLTGPHTARFQQEARAIAALNHPHICQLYDVGADYLVMEFVEGSTLRHPLPVEEAVKAAIQIASGLEAAHRKGIIHRDLKPGNIMVTEDGVKLLDFGLAKWEQRPADSDSFSTISVALTEPGVVVGTVAYMSPEQAQGHAVDARSDIFSFGTVLYELLSGERPFRGESPFAILTAVVQEEPPPLHAPAALERIVRRCLAKQPSARYQSISEVKAELEKAMPKAGAQGPSIAVLPFANMSADKENEYFSDGLAEEIINVLAHLPGLKVIARTSAFAFRGKEQDIRKIAEALGVSTVLEGSVRRAGSRIRVTAQLIEAENGSHLWSERYDREMNDVFAVQDEIAAAIAGTLQVKLAVAPAEMRRYEPNLPAYEAYLKAKHYWAKITPESLARSKECYERAITLDPRFALAYIGLADYFLLMTVGAGLLPAHEAMPQVRALARKALDIDPQLPEAHAMLGIVAGVYDYDWKEAGRLFRLALAGDAVSPQVRQWHGLFYLLPVGRPENAIEELERGLQEDPLSLTGRCALAHSLIAAGRYEDAFTELRRALELEENFWYGQVVLACNYALRGRLPEALAIAGEAYSLAPWSPLATGVYAAVLRRTGDASRAGEVLQPLRKAPEAYGAPRGLMTYHLLCDEYDQAVGCAEKSIQQRDGDSLSWLSHFWSTARWPELAKMMNLPENG
jgi:TolB-like protein/predicted Ser/Thr protein kinase